MKDLYLNGKKMCFPEVIELHKLRVYPGDSREICEKAILIVDRLSTEQSAAYSIMQEEAGNKWKDEFEEFFALINHIDEKKGDHVVVAFWDYVRKHFSSEWSNMRRLKES